MDSNAPVLVAYDGSEGAKEAIATAASLFGDRPLVVLSAAQSVAAAAAASVIGVPAGIADDALVRLDEETRLGAEALAGEGAKLAAESGLDATAIGTVTVGNVWGTIVRVADERDVAAVLVGSRGRSNLKSMLLGSVSSGVVHHSGRPVVVVHGASAKLPEAG